MLNKEYHDVHDLLADAKIAIEHGSRRYADRILLFKTLTETLEKYVDREDETAEARRELRAAMREFILTLRDAKSALNEWNLGGEITKRLMSNLRNCLAALDKLNKSVPK